VEEPTADGHSSPPEIAVKTGKGDLRELQTLFNLWHSAGRNVNLWDWLEGFRSAVHRPPEASGGATADANGEERADGDIMDGAVRVKRKRTTPTPGASGNDGGMRETEGRARGGEEMDDEERARLHATFVRFCEEARMMGLVRARGRRVGSRADEVIKGIGMI
jgi:hypothetical protein